MSRRVQWTIFWVVYLLCAGAILWVSAEAAQGPPAL
jgi:hypothetical protein